MRRERTNVLVTAGATMVMIDQVRAITNIFKGRTGTAIAKKFAEAEYNVTLITSSPNLLAKPIPKNLRVIAYKTYDELFSAMSDEIQSKKYHAIIHSAAVSDYYANGVFVKDEQGKLIEIDSSGKIPSTIKESYVRMTPTEKIIDKIRPEWGFTGYLVKFKLQVDISENELRAIADKSREASRADMVVANCLEWCEERAEVRTKNTVTPVSRKDLARVIMEIIEEEIL